MHQVIAKSVSLPRFDCEISVLGFLKEQAEPHMEKGISRLDHLRKLLSVEDDEESQKRGVRREEILSGWHRQMSRLLPWVKMIVGKSDRLSSKKF